MRARRNRRGGGPRHVVLLGPQTERPSVAAAVRDLEVAGHVSPGSPIGIVTAGWRDREGDPGIVDAELAERTVDLELYRRADRLADIDPELARAHKELQDKLKLLRRAYNIRLAARIEAHQRLSELRGDEAVLARERADTIESLRRLDDRHLDRVVELRSEFERTHAPAERESVQQQRAEIEHALADVDVVIVAGGHIASLLNRLRLFGGRELFGARAVIGWSAGAMAMAERVVLFHDRPPWGAGNPESFDRGLGLVDGVVPLPNASVRLDLEDRGRTARLAARFSPSACVLLDPGARIDWVDGVWESRGHVLRVDRAGRRIRFRIQAA